MFIHKHKKSLLEFWWGLHWINLSVRGEWWWLSAKSYTTSVTPQTVALQVPLCVWFPRQEYWLLFFSHSVLSGSLWPHGLQHAGPSLSFTISQSLLWESCLLSQLWHPTILSSVIPFSSCSQSFPESGSFLMSWLFSFSIHPSNEYSGLISFRID